MKKKWLVIICIVFGFLVIGGMGSDNDSGKSEPIRTITITVSDLHENFEIPEKCYFINGIFYSKSAGKIQCDTYEHFIIKFNLVYYINQDISSAWFKYRDIVAHQDVIVYIDLKHCDDKVSDNYYIEDDGLELMWINASDLHSFTPIAPYYTFDNGFIWTESHERLDYITFDEFKSAFDSTDDVYIAAFTFLDSENLERQLFVKVELDK